MESNQDRAEGLQPRRQLPRFREKTFNAWEAPRVGSIRKMDGAYYMVVSVEKVPTTLQLLDGSSVEVPGTACNVRYMIRTAEQKRLYEQAQLAP